MKFTIGLTMLLVSVFAVNSNVAQECSSNQSAYTNNSTNYVNTVAAPARKDKTIVETAAASKDFSTLVAAVKAADLAGALSGDGPFTVFAPTNAAFEKLPAGTVETLLKPENKGKLASILKYHVVSGKIMAGDVLKALKVDTLQGSSANISLNIEGAKIVKTDIECSNGVIHVIDAVILPKAK
jgi:transforming growth factor-beta-induced protein